MRKVLLLDSGAGVGDDQGGRPAVRRHGDGHAPAARGELQGVVDEVGEKTLQVVALHRDRDLAIRPGQRKREAAVLRQRREQLDGLRGDLSGVDRFAASGAAARLRPRDFEHGIDHRQHRGALLGDVLGEPGAVAGGERQLRPAAQAGDRGAQVVRDVVRDGPEVGHDGLRLRDHRVEPLDEGHLVRTGQQGVDAAHEDARKEPAEGAAEAERQREADDARDEDEPHGPGVVEVGEDEDPSVEGAFSADAPVSAADRRRPARPRRKREAGGGEAHRRLPRNGRGGEDLAAVGREEEVDGVPLPDLVLFIGELERHVADAIRGRQADRLDAVVRSGQVEDERLAGALAGDPVARRPVGEAADRADVRMGADDGRADRGGDVVPSDRTLRPGVLGPGEVFRGKLRELEVEVRLGLADLPGCVDAVEGREPHEQQQPEQGEVGARDARAERGEGAAPSRGHSRTPGRS